MSAKTTNKKSAIFFFKPKFTHQKIHPKELNWTNLTKNGPELPRWGHLLWNSFENRKRTFFFGPQNQTHRIRSTTLSWPEFSRLLLDGKLSHILLVLNSGRMVAPCGTRIKRFREIFASSLDYMGLVAPEHLSPCRSSMVLATRETRHIGFTLGWLSFFRCRIFLSLAVSISFITTVINSISCEM